MISAMYSQHLRDEQICDYNNRNNKETKILILSLEAGGAGQQTAVYFCKMSLIERMITKYVPNLYWSQDNGCSLLHTCKQTPQHTQHCSRC